jgi:Xaa-Pro aminopeptidase
MTRGFPPEEFEVRWERLRSAMTEVRLDAILVSTEANFQYISGFASQTWVSPTRPRYLILPRSTAPIAVLPTSNVQGLLATTPVEDVRSWQAPNPEDDGLSLVAGALREAATTYGAVGTEMGPESRLGFPAADFLRLIEAVRPIEIRDTSRLLQRLRMIKSPREIEKIRTVAGVASECFERLPGLVAPGQTMREVCRTLHTELIRCGSDKVPYLVGEAGFGGYETVMMGPDDRVLAPGDLVFIDTGAVYDGYFCDFDRHYGVGHVAPEARRAYDAVYRATDIGLAAARPGKTLSEVWRAMADSLAAAGLEPTYVGRMGHGIGLNHTEPPSVNAVDPTVLEPGLVFTLEPSARYELAQAPGRRKLMVHEENVVVTDSGVELLSRRASPVISLLPSGQAPGAARP